MRPSFRLALCLLLPAWAAAQSVDMGGGAHLNYQGNLGIAQWAFPRKGGEGRSHFATAWLGEADLTFSLAPKVPVEFRIHPRFNYDPDRDESGDEYTSLPTRFDDLYLDWFTRWFELRAGWQVFSWKVVESFSQADILNQADRAEDFFDPPKIGEPAARARFILPTRVQNVLELYYLPYFTPAPLPGPGSRYWFFPGKPVRVMRSADDYTYAVEEERWRPQWAARWQTQLFETFDVAAYYFHGYRRFPQLVPVGAPGPAGVVLTHHYSPIFQGGLTFQGAVGNWLWKGETAYIRSEADQISPSGSVVDPYLAYTGGLEYTFYSPLIQNHDLGAILELIGDTDAGKDEDELEGFRPFRSHVFAGLRYVFNNPGDRSVLAGAFVDYLNGDLIYRAEYSERFFSRVSAKVDVSGLNAEPGSQFQPFEKAIRLAAEAKVHF